MARLESSPSVRHHTRPIATALVRWAGRSHQKQQLIGLPWSPRRRPFSLVFPHPASYYETVAGKLPPILATCWLGHVACDPLRARAHDRRAPFPPPSARSLAAEHARFATVRKSTASTSTHRNCSSLRRRFSLIHSDLAWRRQAGRRCPHQTTRRGERKTSRSRAATQHPARRGPSIQAG